MSALKKRHHLVSKFYLKYFADDAGRITTIRLDNKRQFVQSVYNATVIKDFNTAVGFDGEPTDQAEDSFGEIEGVAAPVWQSVAGGKWPLSEEERGSMAAWIGLQLLRGTRVRKAIGQLKSDALNLEIMAQGRKGLRDALAATGEPHDADAVDEQWIDLFSDPISIDAHPNEHLLHVARTLPELIEPLLDRLWILTTFRRKSLATSDHPAIVVPNPELTQMGMGTGILNAAELYVPLTRRLSLAMYLRDTLPPELSSAPHLAQPGCAKTALYGNYLAVMSARDAVFHHPEDSPIGGLDLPEPRTVEVMTDGDPWKFMPEADRQFLVDSGVNPNTRGTWPSPATTEEP